MSIPLVIIIGRANVGKSTLFNRLVRNRTAIVNDLPGVTRDRIYERAEWFGKTFLVVDTGGIDIPGDGEIQSQVLKQAEIAQDQADAVIFVADRQLGLLPQDIEVVDKLRKSGKPLFVAVNKVDHPSHEPDVLEFSQLGMDRLYPISAEHGEGISVLLEDILTLFPAPEEPPDDEESIRVAIIGRPNVGKSSLVNRLTRSERCIVAKTPGTTRDAIDTQLESEGKKFTLVDTAGIRRKGKTRLLLDKYSVIMALKAMERCDIVVLALDGSGEISDQDATIAGYAYERGRACLIAVNKWDLNKGSGRDFKEVEDEIRDQLKFLDYAPILAVSAKTGRGLDKLLPKVHEVYLEYSREIPTARLNACFEKAIRRNPMSSYRGKFLKMFYSTQVKSRPPTFRCFVNYPKGIHFSYRRYLINSLRKAFGLSGTPVRLIFSSRQEAQ